MKILLFVVKHLIFLNQIPQYNVNHTVSHRREAGGTLDLDHDLVVSTSDCVPELQNIFFNSKYETLYHCTIPATFSPLSIPSEFSR